MEKEKRKNKRNYRLRKNKWDYSWIKFRRTMNMLDRSIVASLYYGKATIIK